MMFEVAWTEFNRKDEVILRRKEFKSEKAMLKFIDKISESDNFCEFYGTRKIEDKKEVI